MLNFLLYAAASLIWGSTWLGIKLQLTGVPPILSVSYRFCLAALILLIYCRLTNKPLYFSWRNHRYLASIGNIVGTRNAKNGVPVTQANAFGMAYGGVLTLGIHFVMGGSLSMDWSIGYLGPLLYLTLFGSIAAFGCYMLLINRIGAEYAAYVTLLMPIIALVFSTLFEGYHWSANALVGVVLVLSGNLIILTPQWKLRRIKAKVKNDEFVPAKS